MSVQAVPQGFHTLTPHLVLNNASEAIAFYKKAFGAVELHRMPGPGGKGVMHAMIQIGDSFVMLADEFPEQKTDICLASPATLGNTPVALHLYVQDADAVFHQAVAAGAKATMPPQDMFWGDRYGQVTDPFGHRWAIATHTEDVSPEEMGARASKLFGGG